MTLTPIFFLMISLVISLSVNHAWGQNATGQTATGQTAKPTNHTQQGASADGAGKVNLDRSLEPANQDEISALFQNVIAVQRKAKVKSGKFLFSPIMSFDFSDSVYTMYGLNLNFGYALGEFWEVYFNYVPSFVANERSIAKKVRELPAYADGSKPAINAEKAKSAMGIEINWVPIYGKDSWGPFGIIRSDTFFNLHIGQIKYDQNTGMKYKLALGKTFFLDPVWNLRVQAGGAMIEAYSSSDSATQPKKESVIIGLLEAGVVFYF